MKAVESGVIGAKMETMDQIEELLTRGVEKIYPSKGELEKVLRSGKKLRLYQGFDPSMPSLHLGNFVGLMKLRQWQKLGHEVIFLVGDFTGRIGDPTDKLATRKQLTAQETRKNSDTWQQQAARVLDFAGSNPVKIRYNSEWSDKMTFKDVIEISANLTVQQMLERDMFQERLKEGKPIHLHEFLYPVAQGYDSVAMDVDLEVGGNDQTFNMLAGRTLMKALKNKEKYVMTTKLLVDKEGKKVGKTTGNALFLDSTPGNFFGGIMSFPDEVILLAFELLTEVPLEGLAAKISQNPMAQKKQLAFEIVKLLWGQQSATQAQTDFENTFQNREIPENIPTYTTSLNSLPTISLLVDSNLAGTRSEAKRLIEQGAVEINNVKVGDVNSSTNTQNNPIIKVGKKRFVKIIKSS